MSGAIEADDLYGDLEDDGSDIEKNDECSVASQTAKVKELENQVRQHQFLKKKIRDAKTRTKTRKKYKQNKKLRSKVSILETNISRLFKTAKLEIDRKDKKIEELYREIERLSNARR